MIQVKSITIEEFRGIRSLTLDLGCKNFSVCGPNGTGKSGIVDAIEFALTGNVSRLSGRGTGVVSLKDHGPHVDSRNRPDKARVALTVSIPALNKTVTIDRTVKNANKPTVSPADPDVIRVLGYVALHPEFVLSRRELIRYVISAPGDRAKEVQSLLRLDQVEDLRVVLLKIKNGYEKQVDPLKREKKQSQEQLLRVLEITQLTTEKLLEAVNARRKILGIDPIEALTSTTSLKDGISANPSTGLAQRIPKIQAVADISTLKKVIERIGGAEVQELRAKDVQKISDLNSDPAVSDSVTREKFLRSAISLIDSDSCPVCDTPWPADELRSLINDKLKHFDEIAKKRTEAEEQLQGLKDILAELEGAVSNVERYGKLATPPIDVSPLAAFISAIASNRKQLEDFLPLSATISVLNDLPTVPARVMETITQIEKNVSAIPEPTLQDATRDYLTISQERFEALRGIARRLKQAEEQAQIAGKIYDTYAEVSTNLLNGIYKMVEKKFSEFYRFTNSKDEGSFEARLIPSYGKLGFDVDFYGRGFFPPGAYHSEGHQDSMGVCLYLALMDHLLKKSFSFAVLDDVLMSVDSGHRREVCTLLREKFPNTQFILTTHDPIWFRQMKTAGLIGARASIHFKNWEVGVGPTEWDNRDVWNEINDYLGRNEVREAAGLLRHYLEYLSTEICHRLRASVEFRADAQYTVGDLLPRAVKQLGDLLKRGVTTAESWARTEDAKALAALRKEFEEAVTKSNIEQWQINPLVHYNEWAIMTKNDFAPVVSAFRNLTDFFFCPNCHSLFYVVPGHGPIENLRCACGSGINVKPKKK
jgi:recombinational DNA repair ATPase RecF